MPSNKGKVIPVADLAEASLVPGVVQRHEAWRRQAAIALAQSSFVVGSVYLKSVITDLEEVHGGSSHPGFNPVVFAFAREATAAPILLGLAQYKGTLVPARRDPPSSSCSASASLPASCSTCWVSTCLAWWWPPASSPPSPSSPPCWASRYARRRPTPASWPASGSASWTPRPWSSVAWPARLAWIVPTLRRGLAWHRDGKPFRKLRHQAYVGRERAINRLAEQFRAPPGMTTIVGVGNWSAQDQGGIMRGPPPGPWIRFLRRLRLVCRVVVIDEHRTSKLCCACHTTLHAHQYVRVRNGEEKLVDVWDTKRCMNRGCRVHVVNRDVNGAVNMLMLIKCFFAHALHPTTFGGPSASPSFPPTHPPPRFAIRGNQLRQRYPVHGNKLLATGASPEGGGIPCFPGCPLTPFFQGPPSGCGIQTVPG
ncbi:hypothetical protein ACKKBF_B39910 [Auxenochlorella protothecoides x Auxenochlorella symbiontica]